LGKSVNPAACFARLKVDSLKKLVQQIGRTRLMIAGGVTLAVLGVLVWLTLSAQNPNMALLYADLDPSAAGAISEKLKTANIPFEASADGSSIRAPENRLGEIRMMLAGEQLGGGVGYELLDKQDALGTTSFLQQVNHLRAMEGELSRTIQSLQSVAHARVHLVVPQQQLFEQQHRTPSASVILKTRGQLAPSKVNAIRHLVASSVPDLEPGRISIVDQNGTLLARADGNNAGVGDDLNERQSIVEQRLRTQVETLLERIVGPGRVRVEVSALLDLSQVREQAEVYDPDKQVVARSTSVEKNDQNKDSESGGEVSVANNLPEAEAATGEPGTNSQSASAETSEQVDYSNSKTMTTTVRESGTIKRLSVAVLVDGAYTPNGDAKMTYSARAPAELEQYKRLVQNAVGFDEDRGDTVEVVNLRFANDPDLAAGKEDTTLPFGLSSADLVRLIQTAVLVSALLAALLFVVRPLMQRANRDLSNALHPAGPGIPQLDGPQGHLALAPPNDDDMNDLISRAAAGDESAIALLEARRNGQRGGIENEIDIAQIEGRLKLSAVRKVGEVIERNPREAASVIRQWMYN
jgi:flagellar M-ring protein FliF